MIPIGVEAFSMGLDGDPYFCPECGARGQEWYLPNELAEDCIGNYFGVCSRCGITVTEDDYRGVVALEPCNCGLCDQEMPF